MEIIGHQKQWQFLKKTAQLQRLSHAYLFSGPSQIGKKTLALEFIKFLNCRDEKRNSRPCQICKSCQLIDQKVYPDLQIVEPRNQDIQISQIRDLRWRLSLHPYGGQIKAAIIDQAHSMNQEAQSAFLKILEEPKGKTLFILISESPERLLPTIFSRCERVRFHSISQNEIENYLQKKGLSEKKARELAQFSFGKPGLALNFLSDPQKLEIQQEVIKEIIKIRTASLNSRFQYAKKISGNGQNLMEILEVWLRYFRKMLLSAEGDKQFSQYSSNKLIKVIKLLQNTIFSLSTTNVNPRLALEVLFLEI